MSHVHKFPRHTVQECNCEEAQTSTNLKVAREIANDFFFDGGHVNKELTKKIEVAISTAREEGRRDGIAEAARVAESGYLHGTDAKDDDYACSTCGGDIRAACCSWAFNYNGNKEIASAIRSLSTHKEG